MRKLIGLVLAATLAVQAAASLKVTSSTVHDNWPMPKDSTADGQDRSPDLDWQGVPGGARSVALTCTDPDAPGGTFCHWLAYNLPPRLHHLPAAVPRDATPGVLGGGVQGTNDFGHVGYNGPAPPPGAPHRYIFTVYALDTTVSGAIHGRADLEKAMAGHILAQGQILGTWRR